MDASIVIAIVALIVEVIGVLVAITTAAKSKAFLWRIMAVLLTLLLISTIGYVIYETSRDDPSPKVTITDPQTGAYNVGWRVTVRGTAEHIDPGATLWLVIRPENGKLYPQNTPPIVQQNDEWSGICLLGIDEESGYSSSLPTSPPKTALKITLRAHSFQATQGTNNGRKV
ncbi:MAG: hypothetical protein K8S97_10820 [Anaerolineae bacterium]|nr:hypothetical protein [Anaerolineae bacterium]